MNVNEFNARAADSSLREIKKILNDDYGVGFFAASTTVLLWAAEQCSNPRAALAAANVARAGSPHAYSGDLPSEASTPIGADMTAKIVKGPFALVSSGNCTESWMVDGEDIQARANAAMAPYWGDTATVIQRDLHGFGIQVEGDPYVAVIFGTRELAERRLAGNS